MSGSTESAVAPQCPNCGELSPGRFCARCGQEYRETLPRIRDWVAEVIDELFLIDGKLARTFSRLLRPGALTEEWLAGRRVHYVRPFRLYLVAAAVWLVAWRLEGAVAAKPLLLPTFFYVYYLTGSVPVMTMVSRLAFSPRARDTSLIPFVVLSLHYHVILLTLVSCARLTSVVTYWAGSTPSYSLRGVAFMVAAAYLALAARRVFKLSWSRAILGAYVVTLVVSSVELLIRVAAVAVWQRLAA